MLNISLRTHRDLLLSFLLLLLSIVVIVWSNFSISTLIAAVVILSVGGYLLWEVSQIRLREAEAAAE